MVVYIDKKEDGAITEPCGTPLITGAQSEYVHMSRVASYPSIISQPKCLEGQCYRISQVSGLVCGVPQSTQLQMSTNTVWKVPAS